MIKLLPLMLLGFMVTFSSVSSPLREPVYFEKQWAVGLGSEVYVVGNHPDVGNWDPAKAIKLQWDDGDYWRGHIGVQVGTTLEYQFIARVNATNQHCDSNNVTWEGVPNQTVSRPAHPPPTFSGKTIYLVSNWDSAFLLYRVGTNWIDAPMTYVEPGRVAGEKVWKVSGIGTPGEYLEFIPHGFIGATEYWDNTSEGNYFTPLDVLWIQDKQVFNYRPVANPSVSRVEKDHWVGTSYHPDVPARNVDIYLPRGYDNQPFRRYPVLYMHDGQNVFKPGGTFGTWAAEDGADTEINMGRSRECIIVAIDNGNDYGSNRYNEYLPPGDEISGYGPGIADQYLSFVLDNVKPYLDSHFRTRPEAEHTGVAGSSMGGLVSHYMVQENASIGFAGVFSPAYTRAPNYMA